MSPVMAAIICNLPIAELKKLRKSCLSLRSIMRKNSEEQRDLEDFYYQIRERDVNFRAAGFYSVNKSLSVSFLKQVIMYFIAIIQVLKL